MAQSSKGLKIHVDSREQAELDFVIGDRVVEIVREGLSFGDYAGSIWQGDKWVQLPIFFERKGYGDLFLSLTSGMERLKREFERAKQFDATMYLIIEGSLDQVYKGFKHSTISGQQIVKTLMTLRVKYGIEPIFCNSRDEMKAHIVETYEAVERNWKR